MNAAGGPCSCCPDRQRDEENLFPPGKSNYFVKKACGGCSPDSSGDIKNVGKSETIGSALRKGSGSIREKKGVWLLRRKIRFGEEKQWLSEVASEIRVSGLSLKLQGSKETK